MWNSITQCQQNSGSTSWYPTGTSSSGPPPESRRNTKRTLSNSCVGRKRTKATCGSCKGKCAASLTPYPTYSASNLKKEKVALITAYDSNATESANGEGDRNVIFTVFAGISSLIMEKGINETARIHRFLRTQSKVFHGLFIETRNSP